MTTDKFKIVEFRTLNISDLFEAYGDECSNYDYPKIMQCVKSGLERGTEINDCSFFMSPGDKVFIKEK